MGYCLHPYVPPPTPPGVNTELRMTNRHHSLPFPGRYGNGVSEGAV